ncbi:MAG: ATP-binding protein [Oscillospiraceae bacterium]|nr:ATP-binding protein [Oscillospiraceae bacterium]
MSMRIRAMLAIILITLAVTCANFFSSLIFTTRSITETMEQELSLALDIANTVVVTKTGLLKANAETMAERLLKSSSVGAMAMIMQQQLNEFPEFISLAVYDRNGIYASYGSESAHDVYQNDYEYIQTAFSGIRFLSSPHFNSSNGNLVMHVFVPMGDDLVLSATIPGLYFSELLAEYRLWQTGSIFIVDSEGTFVASYRTDLVMYQRNFITESKTNAELKPSADFYQKMITSTQPGSGLYDFEGKERFCVYKSVTDSLAGWHIAVTAPVAESPQSTIKSSLLFASAFFFAIGALVSVLVSGFAVKPFIKIEAQNRNLEHLNETVQAQAAQILDEHERTEVLLDATPLACRLWNKDFKVFECNEESVKLFGLESKQEYMDRIFDLSPEFQPDGMDSREKTILTLEKAFKEDMEPFEWLHQRLDGTPLPCEVTLVRVKHGGEDVIAGYTRDLRAEKRMLSEIEEIMQDLRTANSAKSDFLAKMSHEMRTPLNAIIGLSELTLEDEDVRAEARMNIEKVSNAGTTLLHTVNDILDISKIEAGKIDIVAAIYDLPSLLYDTMTQSAVYINEKPIDFLLDIEEDLPTQLCGDELRIRQILNNLLSNAFKYTKEGYVELGVRCEALADDGNSGGLAEIEGDGAAVSADADGADAGETQDAGEEKYRMTVWVRDTGAGIKQESLDMLFDEFVMVDSQAARQTMGTGLGLPITKRLVELMGGTITVESEFGKGSLFKASFIQTHASETHIGAEVVANLKTFSYSDHKRHSNAGIVRTKMPYARVLVVDDTVTNLDVAKGLLKPYGMKVDCVTSGEQAIDAIRLENVKYDAILMDHMMPVMDGIEATNHIRDLDTLYAKTIPIIACTANAVTGSSEMFLRQGFQAFISKPIDITRLNDVLRTWVRDKDREKEYYENNPEEAADSAQGRDGADGESPASVAARNYYLRVLDSLREDIDVDKGLERFSGDAEVYLGILSSYAANTRPLLDEVKGVTQQTLSEYAIIVHGIKGSSRVIYAEKPADLAEALETASRNGDMDFVTANNAGLVEALEKLLGIFDEALRTAAVDEPVVEKPKKDKPDETLLRKLMSACGDYDPDAVENIFKEIDSFDYETGGEHVKWIRDAIDQFAYAKIAERINELLA